MRLTRKDDDNSNQNNNSLEYDYFSQDLTAYNSIQANNNIQAPIVYDGFSTIEMPFDWSATAGRVFPLNRPNKHWTDINGNIINSAIDDTSTTSFTTTNTTTCDINIDPLLI